MAKGQEIKKEVQSKIIEIFEGAFLYNDGKEIRIPMIEDGEPIQIKVALTAAKDVVSPGDENALPAAAPVTKIDFNQPIEKKEVIHIEPTQAEKENVSDLLRSLGL